MAFKGKIAAGVPRRYKIAEPYENILFQGGI
jgi:hypothetical protein